MSTKSWDSFRGLDCHSTKLGGQAPFDNKGHCRFNLCHQNSLPTSSYSTLSSKKRYQGTTFWCFTSKLNFPLVTKLSQSALNTRVVPVARLQPVAITTANNALLTLEVSWLYEIIWIYINNNYKQNYYLYST